MGEPVDYKYYAKWKGWDKDRFGLVSHGSRVAFKGEFDALLESTSDVLEIGFGNGQLLGYFRSQGHRVVGVEINESLVSIAKEKGYTCYMGKAWEVPELKSCRFDLIVGIAVAEHLSYSDLISLFGWARRILRTSGALVLKFPEGSSPMALGYQNGDFTHISCLTRTKIEALCNLTDMQLADYRDEQLVSDKLCALGLFGRLSLSILRIYARFFKIFIRTACFPLNPKLSLATNSIAVIKPSKLLGGASRGS